MHKFTLLILVFSISALSCKNPIHEETKARDEQELLALIRQWSNTDSLAIPGVQLAYQEALDEFLTHYPNNPEHQNFLFLAANNDVNLKNFNRAAMRYAEYSERYPKNRSHADAVFAAGFLYHNELGQLDSAKKYFETFLITYPDHMLAEAAQNELRFLGKTPEEMLNTLRKEQANDSLN
jgi:tetratricopeptide (TPR) repeat protein